MYIYNIIIVHVCVIYIYIHTYSMCINIHIYIYTHYNIIYTHKHIISNKPNNRISFPRKNTTGKSLGPGEKTSPSCGIATPGSAGSAPLRQLDSLPTTLEPELPWHEAAPIGT